MRTHKIRFYPDTKQEDLLRQSCGVARFTYNWGLSKWTELYKSGEKVNYFILKSLFNKEKIENKNLSWIYSVTKCAPEYALKDLSNAFAKFFKKENSYPNFKKKRAGIGSFSISNDQFWVKRNICKLPRIGKVKLSEELRFSGKIMKGTISCYAGFWFISISVDTVAGKNENGKAVGIDLGLSNIVVTSYGEKFNQPDVKKETKKVVKEHKALSRKKKGSNNHLKQKIKLQKAYYKLTNKKDDWINKLVYNLSSGYQFICLEDLNIKGMMKNKKLSAKFQQVGLYKIVEKLKAKATVLQVGRFFPSTRLCSNCGYKNNILTLHDRFWTCPECNVYHDRDTNAAKNILAETFGEFTPVDRKALALVSV